MPSSSSVWKFSTLSSTSGEFLFLCRIEVIPSLGDMTLTLGVMGPVMLKLLELIGGRELGDSKQLLMSAFLCISNYFRSLGVNSIYLRCYHSVQQSCVTMGSMIMQLLTLNALSNYSMYSAYSDFWLLVISRSNLLLIRLVRLLTLWIQAGYKCWYAFRLDLKNRLIRQLQIYSCFYRSTPWEQQDSISRGRPRRLQMKSFLMLARLDAMTAELIYFLLIFDSTTMMILQIYLRNSTKSEGKNSINSQRFLVIDASQTSQKSKFVKKLNLFAKSMTSWLNLRNTGMQKHTRQDSTSLNSGFLEGQNRLLLFLMESTQAQTRLVIICSPLNSISLKYLLTFFLSLSSRVCSQKQTRSRLRQTASGACSSMKEIRCSLLEKMTLLTSLMMFWRSFLRKWLLIEAVLLAMMSLYCSSIALVSLSNLFSLLRMYSMVSSRSQIQRWFWLGPSAALRAPLSNICFIFLQKSPSVMKSLRKVTRLELRLSSPSCCLKECPIVSPPMCELEDTIRELLQMELFILFLLLMEYRLYTMDSRMMRA